MSQGDELRRIVVYVDDRPHELLGGAEVWAVAERLPLETRFALESGQAYLADRAGHELGSGGALADGQRLYVVWRA